MKKGNLPYYFILPAFVFLLLISIFPVGYNFFMSVHQYILYRPPRDFIGINNYLNLITDKAFIHSLGVVLLYLILALGFQIPLGLGLALLLNRRRKGSRIFNTIVIFPMVTTPIVAGLVWRMMYEPTLGVINYFLTALSLSPSRWLASSKIALLALVLVDTWQWTPFVALTMLAGLKTLPKEPVEAAVVDGASMRQVFRHITLPMLQPLLAIVIVLRTVWIFREFDKIYMMTSGGPSNATTTMGYYVFETAYKWMNIGYAAAMAITMLIFIGIAVTFFFKLFPEEIR